MEEIISYLGLMNLSSIWYFLRLYLSYVNNYLLHSLYIYIFMYNFRLQKKCCGEKLEMLLEINKVRKYNLTQNYYSC